MNWQHLKYFAILAKEEHYTKAAEQLFITQPALSKAIQSLEQNIGVPLFEQKGRRVKLTRFGKLFNSYVHRALKEINDGVQTLHSLINISSGIVNIGSIYTIMSQFIPLLIRDFLQEHPNIKFFTRQQSTVESLNYLEEDVIDLAFTAEYSNEKYSSLERAVVAIEAINIAAPLNHPLAKNKEVQFSSLLNETFIYYNEITGIIHSLAEQLNLAGYDVNKLHISFRATEDNSILGLVKAGLGIAFIVDAPNINTADVAIIKLSDLYLYRKVYMSWKRERYMSPVVNLFRNYVLHAASRHNV